MKLVYDSGSINSLKIVLVAQVTDTHLDEFVNRLDYNKQVKSAGRPPHLCLSSGTLFYSPNASCKYLFKVNGFISAGQVESDESDTDSWLEWEATQLQPALLAGIASSSSKGEGDSTGNLADLLSLLEQHLATDNGEHISSHCGQQVVPLVDIVVWCSLYAWLGDDVKQPSFNMPPLSIASYANISRWYNAIKSALHPYDSKVVVTAKLLDKQLIKTWVSQAVGRGVFPSKLDGGGTQTQVQTGEGVIEESVVRAVPTKEELEATLRQWGTRPHSPTASPLTHTPPLLPKHPILPIPGARNILITSALPYVNNVPHLGNIIGCVLSADVFARYCRLRGYNTLYICGTDEYGTATETKALEEGITPREICDKYYAIHSDCYRWFDIAFDYFGRTTTQHQTDIAQDIFWKLYRNGHLVSQSMEQLLCQTCSRYLADRYVVGTCGACGYAGARGDQCDRCGRLTNATDLVTPTCSVCHSAPVTRTSQHLHLHLPQLVPKLERWLSSPHRPGGSQAPTSWSHSAEVITRAWLNKGLQTRAITRDLQWGTPVPLEGFTDKVFYVWFDAPIGYISITANYTDQWRQWWLNPDNVELYNFMAKDNVPFHSVIFPASLLGTGDDWTLVNHISATEYLNYEAEKFSKSRGVGVFGSDLITLDHPHIPPDIWRFYLLSVRPETQDSAFNWLDLMARNNNELLNNLGNFINRSLAFVAANFESRVPEIRLTDEDRELIVYVNREVQEYIELFEKVRLRDGTRNILSISRLGNQYIQGNKTWLLVKGSEEDRVRAGSVSGLCCHMVALLSALLAPYMPSTSQEIRDQLSLAPELLTSLPQHFAPILQPGHTIGKPKPLFAKLREEDILVLKSRFQGKQNAVAGGAQSGAVANTGDKANLGEMNELEENITKQGNVIRELKSNKAEKSVIDAEVAKLLQLKCHLAQAKGEPVTTPGGKADKKKKKGK